MAVAHLHPPDAGKHNRAQIPTLHARQPGQVGRRHTKREHQYRIARTVSEGYGGRPLYPQYTRRSEHARHRPPRHRFETAFLRASFFPPPVGGFKNRLVVDLYPQGMDADDPMMALLNGSLNKTRRGSPEADLAQNTPAQTERGKNGRRPVIMIDPGHGGEDPGAVSPGGLQEKHVVLSIARETKKQLEALGYNVFMTRNEDVFIPLGVRVAKGRARRADVFVSIHADAFTSPSARGTGVYMLNTKGATSSAAKFLEQTQNNADAVGGVPTSGNRNVDTALLDMTQTATLRDSRKLGKLVLEELGRLNHLHKGRVDEANFAVLRAPDMPSILVETAFLSNPAEEKLLGSESFRRQCAQSIASGVQRYINTSVLKRG
ncbi:K01448 N-acetylmuramoyl-L-alanine amidase [Neisseria meningitidis WUE 2594]|nr:K01448 N-acetylmuramoyl-L-alanine amidase [Neisseria meningitidis WUE 2594]